MIKSKKNLFSLLLTVVLCVSCFACSIFASVNVSATTEPAIVIYDDFSVAGGTGITGTKAIDYNNLTSDEVQGGHDGYGIIPASTWGAYVKPGDAYITYKVQATGDNILSNLKLMFKGYYGCSAIGEYYGSDNTNVKVYYSKDNSSWLTAFNLHDGANSNIPLTNVVTNANGQSGVANGDQNVFGNKSVYAEYTADFSSVVGTSSVMYIKMEILHLTYEEVDAATDRDISVEPYRFNTTDKAIPLDKLGVSLNYIKITADEVERSDDGFVVHNGDTSFDYGTYSEGETTWQETAYEYGGLSIMNGVDYHDETLGNYKTPALAPASTNSEGYITYKYVAPSGTTFKGANLHAVARYFDFNVPGTYEKFEYYISYNNVDFNLIYDAPIKGGNGYSSVTDLDLTEYVDGKSSFYLKLVIGCTNDRTWTNLKEISMDVEFDEVAITINYGGGYSVVVKQFTGTLFDENNIIIPAMFTRVDQNIYATSEMVDTALFDLTAPINSDVSIYIKGEWSGYVINYVLNGGQFLTTAPDSYVSEEGCELISPVKENFDFDGWFTDQEFKTRIKKIAVGMAEHLTLYARWVPVQPDDEDMIVHYDDTDFNFSDYTTAYEWQQNVYAFDNLSLVTVVAQDVFGVANAKCIAPATASSEGYLIYKYVAPNGRNFSGANFSSIARCFDYNSKGAGEKIDYYISFNNYDYTLIHSSLISTVSKGVTTSLDLGNYVFGKTAFYLKVVIGCSSANKDWTCIKEMTMDVEFEKLDLTVDFGDGYTTTIEHYRGETFDSANLVLPESFVREDDLVYTSNKFSQNDVLESTTRIFEDTTLYIKGQWGCYTLTYVLNGGTCDVQPESYFSSKGVALGEPTREGFVFVGWFTDEDFNTPITEIAKGQTGNLTLYAKWTPDIPLGITVDMPKDNGGCNGSLDTAWIIGLVIISLGVVVTTKKYLKNK